MYDAVIFDNDGVLVSRTPYDVLQEAAWAAFDAAGVVDPDPSTVESMVVDVSPAEVREVCEEYGLDPETFWAHRDRLSAERQQAEARAGRKTPYEDVSALDRLSIPLGIVSSNQQATVDFLLTYFGEEHPEQCGACDVCLGRHDPPVVTAAQEDQLRRILEQVQADVPRGDWFEQREVPRHEVDVLVNWLVQRGYIRMEDPLNGRFVLTDAGRAQMAE